MLKKIKKFRKLPMNRFTSPIISLFSPLFSIFALFLFSQAPATCCRLRKIFYLCSAERQRLCAPSATQTYFLMKVYSLLFLGSKSGKFQHGQGKQHTRHLVLVHVGHPLFPTPIRVWGIVYLTIGIPEPRTR